ncbi:MAG: glycosyltransferase [Candidatus Paceibacterota bacterium]
MISFIIPTLNEEKIIEKTISCISILNDKHEIIISDGGSLDKTLEIAKKYNCKISKHEEKEKQTIAGGRNNGAKIAEGDYLAFIDADCFIYDSNSFFKKALNIFEKDKNIVALTVSIKVLPEFEKLSDKVIFRCLNSLYFILNNILHIGGASGEFQMIKNDEFKKVKGFDENLVTGEDHDLFRRLAKIGKTKFVSDLTIYHTGRRAHKIGWAKLLSLWTINSISTIFLKKSSSKVWEEIR